MDIRGSVALVTGSNRGIGRAFVEELASRGAAKIYATARRPETVDVPGVEVLQLDVTDPESVRAAAAAAGDVTLLINNAGSATYTDLVESDMAAIRLEMETHFFGTLSMVRAFAPVLRDNGGGTIVNMLSLLSWFSYLGGTSYGAAKAASWSMTNTVRLELAPQRTHVVGVHVGAVDTEMMAAFTGPKTTAAKVVRDVLDGVEAELFEILVDKRAVDVKASLALDPRTVYAEAIAARRLS